MDNTLAKLFEHNNWANDRMIEDCSALTDEQLDAAPLRASEWSIRRVLLHLVEAQEGYLALLTLPPEERPDVSLAFSELRESARRSGDGLLAIARDETGRQVGVRLRTKDGYHAEPWVVLVQVINHATEHRRQVSFMMRALGETPPDLDGWSFGEVTEALVPVPK